MVWHTAWTSERMWLLRITVWLPAQSLDQVPDLDDLPGVQAHGGLVQDDDLGVAQQGLGDAHPLPVALGRGCSMQPVRARRPMPVASIRSVDLTPRAPPWRRPFALADKGQVLPRRRGPDTEAAAPADSR